MRLSLPPTAKRALAATATVGLILVGACGPPPATPPPPGPAGVSRDVAVRLWTTDYAASSGVSTTWTGSVPTCVSGSVSASYQAAVLRRINYYRTMAGVPAVQLDAAFSAKAGQAALMMAAAGALSHTPASTWPCYTAEGAEAAGKSNLMLGTSGPLAIDGYVQDGGANSPAGHRRWLLYPRTRRMGTGDVPGRTNALWVLDGATTPVSPRDGFVAWPPPGFVPRPVLYARWSFSLQGGDLGAATVAVSRAGRACAVTIVHRDGASGSYGDPALIWELDTGCAPGTGADVAYRVTISGVKVGGVARSYTYQVTAFTP